MLAGSAMKPEVSTNHDSLSMTHVVQEFALTATGGWTLVQDSITVGDAKVAAAA